MDMNERRWKSSLTKETFRLLNGLRTDPPPF